MTYRAYCEGQDFGVDYATREAARAAVAAFRQRWPRKRYYVRKARDVLPAFPVLFRASTHGEVTAVFPEAAASQPWFVGCYSHIGQHSECGREWYLSTRPARPAEYAPLLAELREIYEQGEDSVRLVVRKRWVRA